MEEERYHAVRNRTRTIFNFSVIFAILLIAFSIFYYLVIFQPQKNNQQLEQQLQLKSVDNYKQTSNQKMLSDCLDRVNKGLSDPEFQEAIKGVKANSEDAKIILDLIKQQKEECYKKYPQ